MMNKGLKWLTYILGGIIVIFLLIAGAFKIIAILNEKEQEEAVRKTQEYLANSYPDLNYKIQNISSSTDFKHYGYFEYGVTVKNMNSDEIFTVFYDEKMNRMEDSISLEKQEKHAERDITPKVEKYIKKRFGDTRYIDVSYDIAEGKPMIVITFNNHHEEITQTDFDLFIAYLKGTIGLEHANVNVYYWHGDLSFDLEF
ncbi:hypothetical protein SAMN05421503_1813 [Terribacillus aidingensis]|uniref:Uncharacterized protein n=1 Tax=Terribacillus aidingensis TaxID=586416 RepID=A0A285NRZ7_9BACI|nr:hypothetical protein [Terribacillus aidingensis]SNZ10626.1 hypothetical protein SAMN05421503_1813 [Terribacillus aidingensis]